MYIYTRIYIYIYEYVYNDTLHNFCYTQAYIKKYNDLNAVYSTNTAHIQIYPLNYSTVHSVQYMQ